MSLTSTCIAVCAPLTAVAAVLLFMMAHMLRNGSWTFEVLAAKHGWEKEEKASMCRRGALMYLVASLGLWTSMFLQAPLYRLWLLMPWNQSAQQYAEEHRALESLLATETETAVCSGVGGRRKHIRSATRRFSSSSSPPAEDAIEMSTLEWGHEGIGPSRHFRANALTGVGSNPLMGSGPEPLRNPNATAAAVNATATAANTWGRARGLRSRSSQAFAAEPQGTVTIRPDFTPPESSVAVAGRITTDISSVPSLLPFQQPPYSNNAHASLWSSSGGEHDSVDDIEFLSDVELDGVRHNSLRQIRASGWGMQRDTGPLAATAVPARRNRSHGGELIGGGRGPLLLHSHSRSPHTSASSGNRRGGGESGPVAGAAPTITTLWPGVAANMGNSNPRSSLPGDRQQWQRYPPTAGPPPAMQRQKHKCA